VRNLLALLLALAFAGSASAQPKPCRPVGAAVPGAGVAIVSTSRTRATAVAGSLSFAVAADLQAVRAAGAFSLCNAVAYGLRTQDGHALCESFGSLTSQDQLSASGTTIRFVLVRAKPLTTSDSAFTLSYAPDEACLGTNGRPLPGSSAPPPAALSVRAMRGATFANVSPTPDKLASQQALWSQASLAAAMRGPGIQVGFDSLDRTQLSVGAMVPPRSWLKGAGAAKEEALGGALVFAIALATVIGLVRARLSISTDAPLFRAGWQALGLALGLMICSSVLEASSGRGWSGLNAQSMRPIAEDLRLSAADSPDLLLMLLISFGWMILLAGVGGVLIGLFRRKAPGCRLFGKALVGGSAGAFAATLFSVLVSIVEGPAALGFEAPAFVVSLVIAGLIVRSLRPLATAASAAARPWPWWTRAAAALVLTVTVLFPRDAVLHSSPSAPSVGGNTFFWADLMSGLSVRPLFFASMLLLADACAQAGAGNPELNRRADGALLAIFMLATASFGLLNPLNAAALAALWLAANRLVFFDPPPPGDPAAPAAPLGAAAQLAHPGLRSHRRWRSLAIATGALAMLVLWLQASLQPGGEPGTTYALLAPLSLLIAIFSSGAIGALLLAHGFERIHGDSAGAKAVVVAAVLFAASLAGQFSDVLQHHDVASVLTDRIAIGAALLVVAFFSYDLPTARRAVGDASLKDLFKGTSIAPVVTSLAALVAAIMTALTPITSDEIGKTFRQVLHQNLEQLTQVPSNASPK
jgi:hypothetical protein